LLVLSISPRRGGGGRGGSLETFIGNNSVSALLSPPNAKWSFAPSQSNSLWYSVPCGNSNNPNIISCNTMGLDFKEGMSVSFLFKIQTYYKDWRNIFRFTNVANNSYNGVNNDRIPALFISGTNNSSQPHQLYLSVDDADGYHALYSNMKLELNHPYLFTYSVSYTTGIVSCYINDVLLSSSSYSFDKAGTFFVNDKTTQLWISDKFYPETCYTNPDDHILIQNFTVYQGPVMQQDVDTMMKILYDSVDYVPTSQAAYQDSLLAGKQSTWVTLNLLIGIGVVTGFLVWSSRT